MGQVGNLYRIDKSLLDGILKNKKFKYGTHKDEVDVDKLWESVLFVLGYGFRQPFSNIFMPVNAISCSKLNKHFGPFIRYHGEKEIKELCEKFKELDEAELRSRLDYDIINSLSIYHVSPEDGDTIIKHCLAVMALFKKAEEAGDLIIGSIG